jgi:hypothetical protein
MYRVCVYNYCIPSSITLSLSVYDVKSGVIRGPSFSFCSALELTNIGRIHYSFVRQIAEVR